jgi:hypothetical protein
MGILKYQNFLPEDFMSDYRYTIEEIDQIAGGADGCYFDINMCGPDDKIIVDGHIDSAGLRHLADHLDGLIDES